MLPDRSGKLTILKGKSSHLSYSDFTISPARDGDGEVEGEGEGDGNHERRIMSCLNCRSTAIWVGCSSEPVPAEAASFSH